MEKTIERFITALRDAGIRISTSETLDAFHALQLIGYSDKKIFQDTLAAILAKSPAEKEIFDSCFSRFFSFDFFTGMQARAEAGRSKERVNAPFLARLLLDEDQVGLQQLLSEAAGLADMNKLQHLTQRGRFVRSILNIMGMAELDMYIRHLQALDDPDARTEAEALLRYSEYLEANVREFVEKQLQLLKEKNRNEYFDDFLKNARLTELEEEHFQKMHELIRKMVKRLNDVHSRRKKRARRGQLDFKKTIRENISCQGLLFNPRWKMKKLDRPDIIAICDVSRSVSWIVRFFLLFLYSLNKEIARIRTFIFCSEMVEVTKFFEEQPVEQAVARIQTGGGINVVLAQTDYGESFKDFKRIGLDAVSRKTTVIILGDARSNFFDPRTDIVRTISERCRRLIWLNPETPYLWGSGDSEMDRYAPFCNLVRECSTLRHLELAISALIKD